MCKCIVSYLFLLLFLFPNITTAQFCSAVACRASGILIRFPFWVEGGQPQNCGYPGFNLGCSSSGKTILRLPSSEEFLVRDIDYLAQQIKLYDPEDCLPRRLLELNLSGSPFYPAYYVNYTFLDCPMNLASGFAIPCLSNSTNTVIATISTDYAKSMSTVCNVKANLALPMSWTGQYDNGSDLQLSWFSPDCSDCEAKGGLCGYESNISQEVGCFRNPYAGHTSRGFIAFRIICMSIALVAVVSAVILGCFVCWSHKRNARRGTNSSYQGNNSAAVTPQPVEVTIGLDESTIESFTKVVLGESRRLSGPNDSTCPICLSEYQPKEIIRCIPECKHCFHANCVDEWLKMNITCPVCRNCPSPVQAGETTQ